MNKIIPIIIILLLAGAIGYLVLQERPSQIIEPTPTPTPAISQSDWPGLSDDKKSIVEDIYAENPRVLLSIDHDIIYNFFRTESQLCDESNIDGAPDRRQFCEDKTTFKSMTRFKALENGPSVALSYGRTMIGFAIESDALSPDTVVGIFYPNRTSNNVHLLTNYYLGNEFIRFSPGSDAYFAIKSDCFEGRCALFIKDSVTLEDVFTLNNPGFADTRTADVELVRWVSEREIQYRFSSDEGHNYRFAEF